MTMSNQDLTVLQPYCENDMKKLKKMSQSIFMKFNEPLTKADYDDFYSIANMTLWQAYNSYNPDTGVAFEGFLYSCLQKKFKSELTRRYRKKRILNQFAVSLDAVGEDSECNLMDLIPSDFNTFDEVLKNQGKERFSEKVQLYLSRLSKLQVNILNLVADGYEPYEIRKILGISEKEYTENLQLAKSYENMKFLF